MKVIKKGPSHQLMTRVTDEKIKPMHIQNLEGTHCTWMFPPGIEPGTFRVLGGCDNHYTTETQLFKKEYIFILIFIMYCCSPATLRLDLQLR